MNTHLKWPFKSPHLNLIENLWDYVEQHVKHQKQHSPNLITLLMNKWSQLDVAYLQNLVHLLSDHL